MEFFKFTAFKKNDETTIMTKRKQPIKKSQPKKKKTINTTPKPKTVQKNWLNNTRLHIIIIMALSLVLYANTIPHSYALDDSIVLTENNFTKKGFGGIGEILTTEGFMGFFGKEKNLVAGGRYRPLSLVTFAMEWQLFGENPQVSHFINILLYGATGIVLYLVLLQFFNPKRNGNHLESYFIALATTILFIAHPIHTEAVANIKGRDEIMCLLGSLAAMYFAFKYYYSSKLLHLLTSGILFFLAILSKENAITFLAVIPLAFFFFTKAKFGKIAMATLPALIGAVVFLLIRQSVLGAGAELSGQVGELMNDPFLEMTNSEKYATVTYTLGKYLQLLVFPHPLTHDYYPYHIPIMSWSNLGVITSLLIYISLAIYAFIRLPKKDPFAFGILYFAATFSVVSNVLFPVGTLMSERLVFMPSVGFCLILALLVNQFLIKNKKDILNYKKAAIMVGVLALLFSLKTIIRNPVWQNNYTLFTTDVRTSTNSAKINNAAGGVSIDEAIKPENATQKEALLNQAIGYLNKAVEIHPTYSNAWLLMGNAHFHKGEYDAAIEKYQYILNYNAGYQDAFNNMGMAWYRKGKAAIENNNFQEGLPALEQAYQYIPNHTELVGELGAAYGRLNRTTEAIKMFERVIQLNPNEARAYLNLGYAYFNSGNEALGQQYVQKAYEIDPNLRQ